MRKGERGRGKSAKYRAGREEEGGKKGAKREGS